MNYFISIDSGTTNTRIFLIKDDKILAYEKLSVGAGDTVRTGSNTYLKEKIREGISVLLEKNNIKQEDIECAIASGMITSELGLCEVPHSIAPIGLCEMASGMVKKEIPDVCDFPIYFVAGIKNSSQNTDEQDMMRGEETEALGIMSSIDDCKNMLLVLPGSHLKIVLVIDQKIDKCYTSLLGEASKAISKNTILKDSFTFTNKTDFSALDDGYKSAIENGLNMSLFNVRKLCLFCNKDNDYLSSFFDGVMMSDDVRQIVRTAKQHGLPVFVGGSSPVKEKLAYLIQNQGNIKAIVLSDYITDNSTAFGAVKIYKKMREIL